MRFPGIAAACLEDVLPSVIQIRVLYRRALSAQPVCYECMGDAFASIPRAITPGNTKVTNMIIACFERCRKSSHLKFDIILLCFQFKSIHSFFVQIKHIDQTSSSFLDTYNQVSFGNRIT